MAIKVTWAGAAAIARAAAISLGLTAAVAALAQTLPASITLKTVAEVENRAMVNGREAIKLAPAERLSPGDEVICTVEIRNTSPVPFRLLTVPYRIPEHLRYVADSAVGPGADVSFSVDGGHTYAWPDGLMVDGPGGSTRPATAADYTHILFRLKHGLPGNAVAFVHFRAIVR